MDLAMNYDKLLRSTSLIEMEQVANQINPNTLLALYKYISSNNTISKTIFTSYTSLYNSMDHVVFDIDYNLGIEYPVADPKLTKLKQWIFFINDIHFHSVAHDSLVRHASVLSIGLSLVELTIGFGFRLYKSVILLYALIPISCIIISVIGLIRSKPKSFSDICNEYENFQFMSLPLLVSLLYLLVPIAIVVVRLVMKRSHRHKWISGSTES